MNNIELFEKLTSVLWQDYKGFIRYENDKAPKLTKENDWSWLLLFVPIINILYILMMFVAYIALLVIIIKGILSRRTIARYAYDIEVNTYNIKLIRNKEGNIGICNWEDWYNNKLLIKPSYNNIQRIDEYSYIIKKDCKFGLYNAKQEKLILDCQYDSISNIHDNVYEAHQNGQMTKYNIEGDRILY